MWDVQNQLVDQCLGGESGGREEKLLVGLATCVDSGKNRGSSAIESKMGMRSDRVSGEDMGGFVRENACTKADGEISPIMVCRSGGPGGLGVRNRGTRRQSHDAEASSSQARQSQTCYVLAQ